jgi:hypothetical protein
VGQAVRLDLADHAFGGRRPVMGSGERSAGFRVPRGVESTLDRRDQRGVVGGELELGRGRFEVHHRRGDHGDS